LANSGELAAERRVLPAKSSVDRRHAAERGRRLRRQSGETALIVSPGFVVFVGA
jgi:hypothetical protein